jgi:hypothetical protein
MSNRAHIDFIDKTNRISGETYSGIEVWDDYAESFFDLEDIPSDRMELLRIVRDKADNEIEAILEAVVEGEKGIYILDDWHEWEEIAPVLKGEGKWERTDEEV